jgi:rhodanese-related sulfurtransferase
LIAWFGPRGLSSLLLVLLPVFGGVAGSERLLAICCLVVLCSVVVHGLSPLVFVRRPRLPAASAGTEPGAPSETVGATEKTCALVSSAQQETPEMIPLEEYLKLRESSATTVLLDVRSARDYNRSDEDMGGALRLHPSQVVQEMRRLGVFPETPIIAVCACPEDETAVRVVRDLRQMGWRQARALRDGWESWKKAALPVVQKA